MSINLLTSLNLLTSITFLSQMAKFQEKRLRIKEFLYIKTFTIIYFAQNLFRIMSSQYNARNRPFSVSKMINKELFDKCASEIKNLKQNETLQNQSFIKKQLAHKNGFIKNRFQQKDFSCLAILLKTHLRSFSLLVNENVQLQKESRELKQSNSINQHKFQVLYQQVQELQYQSSRIKSHILNALENKLQHGDKNKPNPQFEPASNKKEFWNEMQVVKQQPLSPHLQTRYNLPFDKIQEVQNSEESSSVIYSELTLKAEVGAFNKFIEQPSKREQKVMRKQQIQKITRRGVNNCQQNEGDLFEISYNMISKKLQPEMLVLPNQIKSRANTQQEMIPLPKKLQSKVNAGKQMIIVPQLESKVEYQEKRKNIYGESVRNNKQYEFRRG